MKIQFSLAQMDIKFGNIEDNFHTATSFIKQAAKAQSEFIIFPELWTTGYDLQSATKFADQIDRGIFKKIERLSHIYQINIGGSILEVEGNHIFNTFTLHNPDHGLINTYRKTHLFRPMSEHLYLTAGNTYSTVSYPWGNMGVCICYDLRFPEIFRKYAEMDCEIILICAEWPAERIHHWRTLLQARAIENQIYIVAVNRVGNDPNITYGGNSCIINPDGQEIIHGNMDQELLTAEIDLDTIKLYREKFNILQDRRLDLDLYSR